MKEQPFYIGQKVMALKDSQFGVFKKGDKFTVLGLKYCCDWSIDIGKLVTKPWLECVVCHKKLSNKNEIRWTYAYLFAPIEESFQSISFSKVMEEELTSVN